MHFTHRRCRIGGREKGAERNGISLPSAGNDLFCFVFSLGETKENWKRAVKQSWVFPALSGISSAGSNLFILLLVKCQMSPVILYPGIAVGGLIITTLIAFFGFREKLRPRQWAGIAFGAVALVLLNL